MLTILFWIFVILTGLCAITFVLQFIVWIDGLPFCFEQESIFPTTMLITNLILMILTYALYCLK